MFKPGTPWHFDFLGLGLRIAALASERGPAEWEAASILARRALETGDGELALVALEELWPGAHPNEGDHLMCIHTYAQRRRRLLIEARQQADLARLDVVRVPVSTEPRPSVTVPVRVVR